jgi:hypothetical protein
LRVEGREDFVKEWPLGELVTVVRPLKGLARSKYLTAAGEC